ncbi:hypothetical protein PCANC_03277 [Puccinia coronata f. sp. avenae]|uniref:Monothiol glutaredoxin-5, mitochondrial n=2 Tax=Puccinia coronata f. sp. avenae TaxID=200324 RepID=A0A2N5VYY9_9BASI|nr:hypothetical protein PCASD_09739 [Puccinia coronata f. sp. avenae]PLW55186.1 hypothetical protein PCANC_03277 [Puccinia coronata f. sp. avenae]
MPKTQPLELRPVTETFSMLGPDDVARVLLEYCWDRPSAARTQAVVPLKAAPLREAGPAQDRRFTARNSRVDHIYIFTTVSPTSPNAIMSLSTFRSSFLRSCQPARPAIPSFRSHIAQSQRSLSEQARTSIQAAVKAHPLVLFMKGTPKMPQCGFSRAVVQLLELHDVPSDKIKTYNCLEDNELRQSIKEFSEWPTIPQVYIDGEFMGGCDMMMEMHRSGELGRLLESKGVLKSPSSIQKENK